MDLHGHKGRVRIIVIFAILFVAVSVLLLLVFFAGKKTHTVRFELNGGTLLSGSLEQSITQGEDATPPTVVKDGAYLRSWSASYKQITKDMVIEAVWEYETTAGIIYSNDQNKNFAEIIGAHKDIRGEVYLGAYYGEKKILSILANAFSDCKNIEKIYLLDGLLSIEDEAFSNCTGLTEIEIPKTVCRIGKGAFRGCESLERVILHEGILEIEEGAFEDCVLLKEIVLPESLVTMGKDVFAGCEGLSITAPTTEELSSEGWTDRWQGDAKVVWSDGKITLPEDDDEDTGIKFPFRPIFPPSKELETLPILKVEEKKDVLDGTLAFQNELQ